MSKRKENLKNLFRNSRTRLILLFTFAVLIIAVVIGVVRIHKTFSLTEKVTLDSGGAANIDSTPGATNPVPRYATLQQQQNRSTAQDALTRGDSSIPTIVSTQNFGDGVEQVGSTTGGGSLGFEALSQRRAGGDTKGLWQQKLRESNCDSATIRSVMVQGATLAAIKQVCSCSQLRAAGIKLAELKSYCSCKELKVAGFNALQLKAACYDARRLRECGFNACDLRSAGFSATALKNAGYSDGELRGAGYSPEEIRQAGGLPDGVTSADVREVGCRVAGLRDLKQRGISAAAIRRISGCNASQLEAAGYSASVLRDAGFNAADLKKAGFTAAELKDAGYSATELKKADFSDAQLSAAGFSPAQIDMASLSLPTGLRPADIEKADCRPQALTRFRQLGVSAHAIETYGHCDAKQLQAAGYSLSSLQSPADDALSQALPAGVNLSQVKAAGCDATQLAALRAKGVTAQAIQKINGCGAAQLKAAGFDATALKAAGFTDSALTASGFTPAQIAAARAGIGAVTDDSGTAVSGAVPSDDAIKSAGCDRSKLSALRAQGASAVRIRQLNDCSAKQLKAAGFAATELKAAGFSDQALRAAGFSNAQVKAADQVLPEDVDESAVKAAGCEPGKLRSLRSRGVSAASIRKLNGCSASALRASGFGATALKDAGFSNQQLKTAGFSDAAIEAADLGLPPGVTKTDVQTAGCDVQKLQALRAEGIDAAAIRKLNGCSATTLKAAGFDAAALKDAGFDDQRLKAAGFSQSAIDAADLELPSGVSQAEVTSAGCDPKKLKILRIKGVSATAIHKLSGCGASVLAAAGFDASDLKAAGFSDQQLKAAGFTGADIDAGDMSLPAGVSRSAVTAAACDPSKLRVLRAKGVSAEAIHKFNGCSAKTLKAAGYNADDLKRAGFTDSALSAAGYSPADIALADAQMGSGNDLDSTIRTAGCDKTALDRLRRQGVSAADIRQRNGCSPAQLKNAGFSAADLKKAGFSKRALKAAGFSDQAIESADLGLPDGVTAAEVKQAGCDARRLSLLHTKGVSAAAIRKSNQCSLAQLKAADFNATNLIRAGFTPTQLKQAGFSQSAIQAALPTPAEALSTLRQAGCSTAAVRQAKEAGLSATQVSQAAGCSARQLLAGGFTPTELRQAGFTAGELKDAGVSAKAMRQAGYDAKSLSQAGFDSAALHNAGYTPSQIDEANGTSQSTDGSSSGGGSSEGNGDNSKSALLGLDKVIKDKTKQPSNQSAATDANSSIINGIEKAASGNNNSKIAARNDEKLQAILKSQKERLKSQRYQQKIQQAAALMGSAATKAMSGWSSVSSASFVATGIEQPTSDKGSAASRAQAAAAAAAAAAQDDDVVVKAGDVMYAVMITSVNSDEPGPVLAQIVSGQFKNAKIIGSFSLPSGAQKLILTFNKMSVPGVSKTVSINAVAIDPNTARTALADRANNHYLLRYGSLFASSFLTGFGDAFESAGTTITIGDASQVEVEQGVGRSALENAVIALADVGTEWGDKIDNLFNKPPTVEIFSGTGIGLLFTQDLKAFD